MTITGMHALLYTPEAEALRAFFRDVLGWKHVDSGGGWLIFALPASELGVHPSEGSTKHELSLICDDVHSTAEELRAKRVEFRGEPVEREYGIVTTMVLPGGVEVDLYEPRHPQP